MNITIRHERPEDYRRVELVVREAFWNLYVPGALEHFTIHNLRKDPAFIPNLTYVIEVDGQIVGSIFYSHSKVVTKDQKEIKTISFGPVSILPSFHRKGLGRKLIEHSIEEAKKLGYKAIITLGYPYHYEPYGFKGGKKYGISMPDGKFYKGLLVLPLEDGVFDGITGYAAFADVLDYFNEEKFVQYDQTFPHKEKAVAKSQKEYEDTCQMLDE